MPQKPDKRHEWFTAREVADLARRHGIEEVPHTESGLIRWIKRVAATYPESFGTDLKTLSRKRSGSVGGGGLEYHLSLFEGPQTANLWRAAVKLAEDREGTEVGAQVPAVGFDTAGGWFEAGDIALMLEALDLVWEPLCRFAVPQIRRVYRNRVHLPQGRCWVGSKMLNGQDVAVTWLPGQPDFVFLWRFDPWRQRLLTHGAAGLIYCATLEWYGETPHLARPPLQAKWQS